MDLVAAVWVLARLLEAEYRVYLLLFECLHQIVLADNSGGGSLAGQDVLGYPVAVEALDGGGGVVEVVLVLAVLDPFTADIAEEFESPFKRFGLAMD